MRTCKDSRQPPSRSDVSNPVHVSAGDQLIPFPGSDIIGFFPSAWLGDKYGRKWPQFGGAIVVCVGVLMQAFAISLWKFFG